MTPTKRNHIIRLIGCTLGGVAFGSALGVACNWLVAVASLGAFMHFVLVLLALALCLYTAQPMADAISRVLTDERLNTAASAVRGFFTRKA